MNSPTTQLPTRYIPGPRFPRLLTQKAIGGTQELSPATTWFAPISKTPALSRPERFTFCEDDLIDIESEDIPDASSCDPYLRIVSSGSRTASPSRRARSFLTRSRVLLRRRKDSCHDSEHQPSRYTPEHRKNTKKRAALGPFLLAFPRPPLSAVQEIQEVSSDDETIYPITADDCSSSQFITEQSLSSQSQFVSFGSAQGHGPSPRDPVAEPGVHAGSSTSISSSPSRSRLLPFSSKAASPLRKSLKRLRSLGKGNGFTSSSEVDEVARAPVADNEAANSLLSLPELSFDSTPLSVLIHEDYGSPVSAEHIDSHEDTDPSISAISSSVVEEEQDQHLPVFKYELVDPKDLTPSPAITTSSSITQSYPIPSPSWFSRNVRDLEPVTQSKRPILRIVSPSPPPLPILPRSQLSDQQAPSPTERANLQRSTESESTTPASAGSSVTLYSVSQQREYLTDDYSRPPSANRRSFISFRQSFYDNRHSIQSFVTCASVVYTEPRAEDQISSVEAQPPRFFLLLCPPTPVSAQSEAPSTSARISLSPLDLFDLDNPFVTSPKADSQPASPVPETRLDTNPEDYQIFYPNPSTQYVNDRFPLPFFLASIVKIILSSNWTIIPDMETNVYGKPAETVDLGEGVDYSGYEWFKDPPPPRPQPPPQASMESFVPDNHVIEQNEGFQIALQSAPSVLYARYKQYGQLGVLAWCAEFGELIDSIKLVGFEGNMFTTTRAQALKTCEEILKLDMQIDMQIIIMYLNSQVARLRRFLDSETVWDDYLQSHFPTIEIPGMSPGPM